VGLHVATCKVEDETVINHDVSLEQIEFFYSALNDCGYKEESQIPSKDTVCTDLENRVMPFAGLSLALNFILGVYIQIMIHDKHFFLDLKYHKYSRLVSLICIPIGMLLCVSLASIALAEYTSPNLCWLAYSISEQKKTYAYRVTIILIPIMLGVYKPLELGIFYSFGCSIFHEDEEQQDDDSKIDSLEPKISEEMPKNTGTVGTNKMQQGTQSDTTRNEIISPTPSDSVDGSTQKRKSRHVADSSKKRKSRRNVDNSSKKRKSRKKTRRSADNLTLKESSDEK